MPVCSASGRLRRLTDPIAWSSKHLLGAEVEVQKPWPLRDGGTPWKGQGLSLGRGFTGIEIELARSGGNTEPSAGADFFAALGQVPLLTSAIAQGTRSVVIQGCFWHQGS